MKINENYGSRNSLISFNDENIQYCYNDLNLKLKVQFNFFELMVLPVDDKVGSYSSKLIRDAYYIFCLFAQWFWKCTNRL